LAFTSFYYISVNICLQFYLFIYFILQDVLPLKSITFCVPISERMAESMEEDIVTIKEEISTVDDICTVYVAEENIKE